VFLATLVIWTVARMLLPSTKHEATCALFAESDRFMRVLDGLQASIASRKEKNVCYACNSMQVCSRYDT
jgi:hypothetical protein